MGPTLLSAIIRISDYFQALARWLADSWQVRGQMPQPGAALVAPLAPATQFPLRKMTSIKPMLVL